MARSPFQGTWQQGVRPTVVTSPDALVYINGETELIGCPSCRRKFDLHKYITSIQVDLSIDSVPGSASLNLVIPRHAVDEFYFDGVPVICPMMEVEIYAKGHFLVEGVPQYYPIFWGIVTEVTDGYSGGQHTLVINCADILKWWELCKMNVNPAWTAPTGTQNSWNMFGNVYHGKNPYDVIWSLSQEAMGDVVIGTGSLNSYSGEASQKPSFSTALSDIMLYWNDRFSRIRSNLLLYGVQGVAVRGATLWEPYRSGKHPPQGTPYASTEVQRANGGPYGGGVVFDPTSPAVTAFKTNMTGIQINFWQSEYQTKLEVANACKEAIGFEFYMDVTGDIVFKPPFYNLDTLPNKPVSWIQDIDIIDWDFSESEAEVVTQVQMSGSYAGNVDYGMPADIEPFTSVTDYHLLRKYGWRTHQVNSEFLGDPMLMFYYGCDMLDRLNAKRHRGSVSIPLRPELRLGFPIYVAPKDQMWYITGISHNIQFGAQAQTTLTLSARRGKFFAPRGIGKLELTGWDNAGVKKNPGINKPQNTSQYRYTGNQLSQGGTFKITVGSAAQIPAPSPDPAKPEEDILGLPADQNPYAPLIFRHPKTGRACGYPNVVMAYTRPFATSGLVTPGSKGKQTKAANPDAKQKKQQSSFDATARATTEMVKAGDKNALRVKYLQNRYMYGLNAAGVFTYLYDAGGTGTDHAISEMVFIPSNRITVTGKESEAVKQFKLQSDGRHSGLIRPVSDDRGFDHIGHFRYGRGISIRDGSLVYSDGGANNKATVGLQLALSGDLSAALAAQSQGLTTLITAQPNPAANLATMQPEDYQTAAIINPVDDSKKGLGPQKGQFVNNQNTNFVETAPLGSAVKNLLQSVESSQLSRALSLAEMTVKFQDGSDDPCDCLMGRSDLTFVMQGIKVTDTSGTTPADKTVGNDPTKLNTKEPIEASQAFPVGRPEQVATQVNKFLYELYNLLDTPHQQYEGALRGSNSPMGNPADMAVGPPSSPVYGPLTPPFNAANRFAVKDLDSISQQFDSAAQQLDSAWNTFSDDLKRKPAILALTKRSDELAARIKDLQAELAGLDPTNPEYASRKKYLEDEIATLQKQKAAVDLLLKQIQAGAPITGDVFASINSWVQEDADAVKAAAKQVGHEFIYNETPTYRNLKDAYNGLKGEK